jgi:hypothetical protein
VNFIQDRFLQSKSFSISADTNQKRDKKTRNHNPPLQFAASSPLPAQHFSSPTDQWIPTKQSSKSMLLPLMGSELLEAAIPLSTVVGTAGPVTVVLDSQVDRLDVSV